MFAQVMFERERFGWQDSSNAKSYPCPNLADDLPVIVWFVSVNRYPHQWDERWLNVPWGGWNYLQRCFSFSYLTKIRGSIASIDISLLLFWMYRISNHGISMKTAGLYTEIHMWLPMIWGGCPLNASMQMNQSDMARADRSTDRWCNSKLSYLCCNFKICLIW